MTVGFALGVLSSKRGRPPALPLLLSLLPSAVVAQEPAATDAGAEANVPEYVSDLIVHLEAYKDGESRAEDGAGIIVAWDERLVWVATARHVVTLVEDPSEEADSVRVEFHHGGGRFVRAVIDTVSTTRDLDLAVIHIDRTAADAAGFTPVEDRLGDSRVLGPGSEVSPIGCPGSNCWRAPFPADRVLFSTPVEVLFQTTFVRGGSSGGGIFNEWNELVGMVFRVEPPGAYALPIDFVVSTIEEWNRPVTIRRPSVPRRGYPTTIGALVLAPTSAGQFPSGRLPSGRVVLTIGLARGLQVNVGALRIAPDGLDGPCPPEPAPNAPLTTVIALRDRAPCEAVVNALVGGLGYRVQAGRLSVQPFGELGMGRVRGRYDIGGVYRLEGQELEIVTYLPNYEAVEQTGFGIGYGLAVDYVVRRRTVLQVVAGQWRFQDPFEGVQLPSGYDPRMPATFVGFGVRMGL